MSFQHLRWKVISKGPARWGQGRVESRHGLLQVGFLGTEVETELKVQDLHRGSEINTGRREGEDTGGGNREHDVVLRGAPVLPTGSSGVGMAIWRHPRSGKGTGPLRPRARHSVRRTP